MTVLQDRYELGARLGVGGQSETFLATDRTSGADVVVKRLVLARIEAWKAVELFEREADVLRRLDHPKIPKLIDAFEVPGDDGPVFYLVQEYVPGRNLQEAIEDGLRWTEDDARRFAFEVLEILDYLQRFHPPVVHRDVKPANLILRPDGSVALVDFGAAQSILPAAGGGSTVVGTFGYMPPEQLSGKAVPATDLYALGATLLFALSHRHPSELPQERLKIRFRDAVLVSEPFALWLDRLLEPAVEDRFSHAARARDGLKRSAALALIRTTGTVSTRTRLREPDGPSWLRIREMEDGVSIEIPPLHNPGERRRALSAIGLLFGGVWLSAVSGWLATPVLIWGAARLIRALAGVQATVGREKLHVRDEVFGIPYRLRGTEFRKVSVSPEAGVEGQKLSGASLWADGIREYTLTHGLTEDERDWLVTTVEEALLDLEARPPADRQDRDSKHVRVNLLPIRSH